MTELTVTSFVATSYVRDLERSRAFYHELGFVEQTSGENALSAWSSLRHGEHQIVLVTSQPPLDLPQLPLLFYFFVDDLDRAMGALREAGGSVEHVGYPPHAPGGEVKTRDPDGNTVLLGQAVRSTTQSTIPEEDPARRFSLLREAAALAKHRADINLTCQVHNARAEPCTEPAEVKLADSWGDTAWACIQHADEALINTSNAFIANQDDEGLGTFLAYRRTRTRADEQPAL